MPRDVNGPKIVTLKQRRNEKLASYELDDSSTSKRLRNRPAALERKLRSAGTCENTVQIPQISGIETPKIQRNIGFPLLHIALSESSDAIEGRMCFRRAGLKYGFRIKRVCENLLHPSSSAPPEPCHQNMRVWRPLN